MVHTVACVMPCMPHISSSLGACRREWFCQVITSSEGQGVLLSECIYPRPFASVVQYSEDASNMRNKGTNTTSSKLDTDFARVSYGVHPGDFSLVQERNNGE